MKFNKIVTGKRATGQSSVVFRKLSKTGKNERYQGSISTKGIKVISDCDGAFCGMQILFSDEHEFIGFKPLYQKKTTTKFFGATELFKSLPLVTGKHYELKITGGIAVIDSGEFKQEGM